MGICLLIVEKQDPTTKIGRCYHDNMDKHLQSSKCEVLVAYWCPCHKSLCGLSKIIHAQWINLQMCLHLVNFFVSFGLGTYKCMNAILAYYEIHGLYVGSSCP